LPTHVAQAPPWHEYGASTSFSRAASRMVWSFEPLIVVSKESTLIVIETSSFKI